MTSCYVDTYRDNSNTNAQMQLPSHAFYELTYCINGCGKECLVDPNCDQLQQGDIIFVSPDVSHRLLLTQIKRAMDGRSAGAA